MRSLRLLLAVGLGLAPTLAGAAAGTTPAFAGGGAGMSLTATMDGQDQRLLAGTKHTVHITVTDTPGEADLRDIDITLRDLDPQPIPVTCDGGGQDGQLSLEPDQSLHCTAVVTARVGYRTLIARATATVPGFGSLLRTDPLHYDGFLPPPPPRQAAPVPAHVPLAPDPAAGQPRPVDPPAPPHFDPPRRVDPPALPGSAAGVRPVPVTGPGGGDCPSEPGASGDCCSNGSGDCCSGGPGDCCSGGPGGSDGCCSGADGGAPHDSACCAGAATAGMGSAGCCRDHEPAAGDHRCCGPADKDKSGVCAKHEGGLAFTGMSAPMLTAAGVGGLVFVAGGFVLVRKFARR